MPPHKSKSLRKLLALGFFIVFAASLAAYLLFNFQDAASQPRQKNVEELIQELKRARASSDARSLPANESETLRKEACRALAALKSEASPAVMILLDVARKDPSPSVRSSAIDALGAIGAPASNAVPVLLTMLKEIPDPFTRDAIRSAIPKIAVSDPNLISEFVELMDSRDRSLATHAATLLNEFGRRSDVPESVLLNALKGRTNDWDRMMFMSSLGKRTSLSGEAIGVLESALFETNYFLRFSAAEALANAGPAAVEAIPSLLKVLDEPMDLTISALQLHTLGRFANKPVELHRTVIRSLGTIGRWASNAIPVLVREYQNPTNVFRFDAALARLKIDANCEAIRGVFATDLQHDDQEIRRLALVKLGDVARFCPETIDLVISAMRSTNRSSRAQAIDLLPNFGTNAMAAREALLKAMADPHLSIRYAAGRALTNLQAMRNEPSPSKPR
jgi:HEAT repeat protein